MKSNFRDLSDGEVIKENDEILGFNADQHGYLIEERYYKIENNSYFSHMIGRKVIGAQIGRIRRKT